MREIWDTCNCDSHVGFGKGTAKIQAGAGIIADSVPESEYQETVNKGKGFAKPLKLPKAIIFSQLKIKNAKLKN